MIRTIALASTALTVLSLSPAAAACVEGPVGTFVCTGDDGAAINDARDAVAVRVEAGATLSAATRPIELGGDNAAVINDGTIAATSTANGTYAIVGTGTGLTVINTGLIESGDRAIEQLGGNGGLSLENDGVIRSRRQAVRALEDRPGASVINRGLIEAQDGRALQLRGEGARVTNEGTLIGGEEVIEGRGDFYLSNTGTIRIRDGVEDEDGVQFGWGELQNYGLIQGSDDGVDIDDGLIHNHTGASIISTGPAVIGGGGGVDIDALRDDGTPGRTLTVVNEGLIEGPVAINADVDSTAALEITNTGTLRGTSGTAINMAPGQADSRLILSGDSTIFGDVIFGGGDDLLTINVLTSGMLGDGVFDGGAGVNLVSLEGFALDDLTRFTLDADLVTLALRTPDGPLSGLFRNFAFWELGGVRYDTDTLADLKAVAPVPLPAALPMLAVALGGLALLRRRARR